MTSHRRSASCTYLLERADAVAEACPAARPRRWPPCSPGVRRGVPRHPDARHRRPGPGRDPDPLRRPPAGGVRHRYDTHAVDAFEVAAVDYLIKPIRAERLAQAVNRVARHAARRAGALAESAGTAPGTRRRASAVPPPDETIAVELGGVTRYVRRSDVVFVEAQRDYVRLSPAPSGHLVRVPLATLEERWAPAGFVRVHRRLLVNPLTSRACAPAGRRRRPRCRPIRAGQPPVHPRGQRRAGAAPPRSAGHGRSWGMTRQRRRRGVVAGRRRAVRRRTHRSAIEDIDRQTGRRSTWAP